MSTSRTSDLPEGMRERTFAFVNSDTNKVIKFGRGTDYPCSSYTFPSVEALGSDFMQPGRHATVMGRKDLSADFFEASFGVLEPNSANKMSAIMAAWNMANFTRPRDGAHRLYYVLGGRSRMMVGTPTRIAPVYHGYKTSYHEGVLRFGLVSPFFYSTDVLSNKLNMAVPSTGAEISAESPISSETEMPAGLLGVLVTPANKNAKMDIAIEAKEASSAYRTILLLTDMAGDFQLSNGPGFSFSRHTSAQGVRTSGADYIGINSPAIRDMAVLPGDTAFRVRVKSKNSTATNVTVSLIWRDCYAGA